MNHEFIRPQRTVEHIDMQVQNSAAISFASRIADGDPVRQKQIIENSRRFQSSFLAAELVRLQRAGEIVGNVVDKNTGQSIPWTGLEGYFVGTGKTPEEIVSAIADIGLQLYKRAIVPIKQSDEYQHVQRYLRTSQGISYDTLAFAKLSTQFGMIAGKLRSNRMDNIEAYDQFRDQTYETVMGRLLGTQNTEADLSGVIPQVDEISESIRYSLQSTPVELSPQQVKGYEYILHAGRALGNNLARGAMQVHSMEHSMIGFYNTAYYLEF